MTEKSSILKIKNFGLRTPKGLISMVKRYFERSLLIALFSLLCGCNKCPAPFEPVICFTPPLALITSLPTPFPPLQKEELQTLWGKELYLGTRFTEEGDWYRAITAFKSSIFLLPKKEVSRREQVEFYLFLSYYFAGKYKEALEIYEASSLFLSERPFPAKRELLLALWESYTKCEQLEQADLILKALPPDDQEDLKLSKAFQDGDICVINEFNDREAINTFLLDFECEMKSPKKAELLQGLFPGAGYAYVGQKKAAMTSLILNALFLGAAIEFWRRGYYAAALITFSFETGWYFGGIKGAGLAANEYNERLFESLGKETLQQERLFPIFKFEFAF